MDGFFGSYNELNGYELNDYNYQYAKDYIKIVANGSTDAGIGAHTGSYPYAYAICVKSVQ